MNNAELGKEFRKSESKTPTSITVAVILFYGFIVIASSVIIYGVTHGWWV